jgi:hypothetical protein
MLEMMEMIQMFEATHSLATILFLKVTLSKTGRKFPLNHLGSSKSLGDPKHGY